MAKDRFPETWHGGETMKRVSVSFDDNFYASLKELAARHETTMADLIRYAVDKTFEDQLDAIAAQRSQRESQEHPESVVSLEDFLKEEGLAVPGTTVESGAKRAKAHSKLQRGENSARAARSAG